MPTGVTISTAHNEARLEGTRSYLDTGSGVGRIRIYDGTRPASGGTVTNLLVEIALDDPCGTVASGVLTLSSGDTPLVTTSGAATWARIVNGNGDFAFDCDVTDAAHPTLGQVILPSTTLFAGGTTELVSGVLG